jgi:hypothetical protein
MPSDSLDFGTKLRLAEAEVAILQRQIAELIAERTRLEEESVQYKLHWTYAIQTCGYLVEQRNAAVSKFEVRSNTLRVGNLLICVSLFPPRHWRKVLLAPTKL